MERQLDPFNLTLVLVLNEILKKWRKEVDLLFGLLFLPHQASLILMRTDD